MDTSSQSECATQIRQQEVVAELGQRALETEDIDTLMHDAAVAVAETLDNEYCNVLELLPGRDEGLLREGVGWREGLLEYSRVETQGDPFESVYLNDIRDEGIGISSDDADRIFEVFQRLHAQNEHAGTGIGLALCRRIVERHGGDIWVTSEPGEGATFLFTLPAAGDSDE